MNNLGGEKELTLYPNPDSIYQQAMDVTEWVMPSTTYPSDLYSSSGLAGAAGGVNGASVGVTSGLTMEADERLRAALQEMDDIMKVSFEGFGSQSDEMCYSRIRSTCEELCVNLKQCLNEGKALEQVPADTVKYLRGWLNAHSQRYDMSTSIHQQMSTYHHVSSSGEETGYASSNHSSTSGEQLLDSDTLKRQVASLQSQLDGCKAKLRDTEARLGSSNDKLIKAEDRLHQEQVNKTYIESHKLDLMSEVAELRRRLQAVETEKAEYRERYEGLQSKVLELHEKLIQRDREISELKNQIAKSGYLTSNNTRHFKLPDNAGDYYFGSLDREALRNRQRSNDTENLKKVVDELLAASQEKDRKISELRKAVSTYQRVEEIILQSHGRPRSSGSESCASTNEKALRVTDLPSGRLPDKHSISNGGPVSGGLYSNGESRNSQPAATSTPVVNTKKQFITGRQNQNGVGQFSAQIANGEQDGVLKRSNSLDTSNFQKALVPEPEKPKSKTPAPIRKATVPRSTTNGGFRDDADTELTSDEEDVPITNEQKKKKGSIKRFFAKLKRSSSQEALDELGPMATGNGFKRGGVRATAGPRLGWNNSNKACSRQERESEHRMPFHQWDSQQVMNWLNEIGLNMYSIEYKRWNKTGNQFLDATQQEIDKELRLCNPLHRKKLHLALEAERSGSLTDRLLYNLRPEWVSKWLDDIGLPQYKDQFYEARVDSRMLNFITVEDLLYMKITNALHHLSIRRGIELLRKHNYNLSVLKRRPGSPEGGDAPTGPPTHENEDISLWTNHRIMEWLRSIDLSEYAANLRGSGVHGALLILEPKFTVEHMATILNIPPTKTLLRRHLTAHFINLVGKEVSDQKSESESGLKLELNTKVKGKKNPFKKGKSTTADYLCPLDLEPIDAQAEDKRIKDAVALYKKELVRNQTSGNK